MSALLSKNLKNLAKKRTMNEADLARATGIKQPVINRLMRGITTNPNVDTLRPIARFFNISVSQLIGDAPLIFTQTPKARQQVTKLPVISWEAACEWETLQSNSDIIEWMPLTLKLSPLAYVLVTKEVILKDTLLPGTCLVVEPEKKPSNQDHVIVLPKGHHRPILRQFLIQEDEHWLTSLNPHYPIMHSFAECQLLGVVVQMYTARQ